MEQYAAWLEREWPSAAASLREGLAELFTVNRLGLPAALRRCERSSAHPTRQPLAQRRDGGAVGGDDVL